MNDEQNKPTTTETNRQTTITKHTLHHTPTHYKTKNLNQPKIIKGLPVLFKQQIENELGDVIFSVINLARFLDISAENALRLTNKKFIKRFIYIENELEKSGKKFEDSSLAELDQIWNQAKAQE